MAVFGRRSKHDSRERPVDPESLRRAVDEGFLIARSAVTSAVANRIILNALQSHVRFDAGLVAEATRDELARLAQEQVEDAERMRDIRAKAQKAKGRSKHQHDYRRGDDLKLRTREATYEALAEALLASRDDAAFIDSIVIAARERAWNDIGGTVVGRLEWAARPTADYEIGRDERLQQMLDEDFAALVAERAGAEPQTPGDDDMVEAASDPADPDAKQS